MNHDLDHLDQRAAEAARDLRSAAERRPIPAFAPDRLPTPAPSSSVRRRRPLAVAAAVLLVVGAAAGTVAVTRDRGGDGNQKASTPTSPRPFVAGELPDGLRPVGVYSADGTTSDLDEEPLLGRFHVYGEDGRAVAGIAVGPPLDELSDDADGDGELAGDERPERVVVDGVDVWQVRPMPDAVWSAVEHGDRTVVVLAPTLSDADRDALAVGATLEGDDLRVDPTTVDRWDLISVLDDGMSAFPIAGTMRGAGSDGHQAVYFGAGGETGVTITSLSADDGAVDALTLVAPDHGPVRVRGRDGIVVRFPIDEHSPDMVSVSWQERPGERITVGGIGLGEDQVLAIAEAVRPAEPDEWRTLVRDTRLGRLSDAINHDGTTVEELGAGELSGGVVWRLTWLTPSPDLDPDQGPQVEGFDVTLRVPGADSSGSTSWSGSAPFGETVVAESGGRHLGAGIVDEAVASVRIERADGSIVGEAPVLEGAGRRAWAVELVEDGLVAVALDASGAELGRMDVPLSGDGYEGTSNTVPCSTVEELDGSGRFSCQGTEIEPATPTGD